MKSVQARHSGESRNSGKLPLPDPGLRRGDGWIAVCKLNDIVSNTGVCALLDGRQVAVFRLDDDRLYAISNHDPFSRANVLSRGIVGDLKGELVVASPVYKQHFSLASGACLEDPAVHIAVFQVRLEGDTVMVRAAPSLTPSTGG